MEGRKKAKLQISSLAHLKNFTTVVADTGDFNQIKHFAPQDATTNPTLLLAASQMPEYRPLVQKALQKAHQLQGDLQDKVQQACIQLGVNFGCQILKIIPGYVSTQVNANHSFNTQKTIQKAKKIISLYQEVGWSKDRILIKIASTWEGIKAAQQLQKEGIHCNLTLLFGFFQAVACAQAKVTLISPFVGRILDWHKNKFQRDFSAFQDPGVVSVTNIYNYYKRHGYKTIVMGASFRNTGQIKALAGCDRLTISPGLLEQLDAEIDSVSPLRRVLSEQEAQELDIPLIPEVTEEIFRWELNEDPMATEKLAEGIRKFNEDLVSLQEFIRRELSNQRLILG